jgi:hypothetical protein
MTRLSSPGHFPTISQIVSTYVGGGALLGKAGVDGEFVEGALLGMRRLSEVGVAMRCFATLFRAFVAFSSGSPIRLFQSSHVHCQVCKLTHLIASLPHLVPWHSDRPGDCFYSRQRLRGR